MQYRVKNLLDQKFRLEGGFDLWDPQAWRTNTLAWRTKSIGRNTGIAAAREVVFWHSCDTDEMSTVAATPYGAMAAAVSEQC